MRSIAIERLIWKETRTLAGLWGVLLALYVGLIGLTTIGSWTFNADLSGRPTLIVLVLTAGFTLAGAGVLFAGEKEERTFGLLQQLPIHPRDLVVAKFSVLTLATASFVLAAVLLTWMLAGFLHSLFRFDLYFARQTDGVWLRSIFGCVVWGVFFSLRSDRVLSAIGWGITAELVTVANIANVFADQRPEWKAPLHWAVIGCVLAVDLWQAWVWTSGSIAAKKPGFSSETRFLWGGVAAAQNALARFWLRGLVYFASAGTPLRRWIGVAIWRELRTVVPAVLVWIGVGASLLALAIPLNNREFGEGVIFGWLLATPLMAGLMVSHGERRGETATFAATHGIAPAGFWWVRQLMWGGTAILLLLPLGLILWEFMPTPHFVYRCLRHLDSGLRYSDFTGLFDLPAGLGQLALSLALSLVVSLFAFGQMCGLWFRSVLVGTLTALLLSVGVLMWHQTVLSLDVPPLLTTWPIALLWLYAAYRQMPSWLNGDRSRHTLLRRAAWTIMPPLLAFVMLSLSRRYQVPEVPLRLDRSGPSAEVQAEAREVFDEAARSLPNDLPEENLALTRLRAGMNWSTSDFATSLQQLRQNPPITFDTLFALQWALQLGSAISSESNAAPRNQNFDVQFQALKLSRLEQSYAKNIRSDLLLALNRRVEICKKLTRWANREDQIVEELERAIPLLEAEFSHDIDIRPMIANWERKML
ncbi:MAG: ABC transporter permease, partial [Planctomycetaceae bacterium]